MSNIVNAENLGKYVDSANKPFLIDARDCDAYNSGHIQGAINIPELKDSFLLDTSEAAQNDFAAGLCILLEDHGLHFKDSVVVYDETAVGSRGAAGRAWFLLRWLGFPNVAFLDGGLSAWAKARRSTTKDVPAKKAPSALAPRLEKWMVATLADVASATQDGVFLLDDRDEAEWEGRSSAPPGYDPDYCPRKGRIPGGHWVLWRRLMKESEGWAFRPTAEIRAVCAEAGLSSLDTPVIIYCFIGTRASNTFLALKAAGFRHVRNYLGSWNEWSRNLQLPIDDALLDSQK